MARTARTAVNESPPSAKKSSSAPTSATPRSSAQTAAIRRWVSVAGGVCAAATGGGSAARSTLPFGFSGSASSTTYALGTMWSGSRACSAARTAETSTSPSGCRTSQAASRRRGSSPTGSTTASATPGTARQAAATSPGSTRKPRIFTWSSIRPRKSTVPSARIRTRSPVR